MAGVALLGCCCAWRRVRPRAGNSKKSKEMNAAAARAATNAFDLELNDAALAVSPCGCVSTPCLDTHSAGNAMGFA